MLWMWEWVDSYVGVRVLNEIGQSGQELFDGVFGWRRLFAPTQVHNHPRDVAQERHRYVGPDEREKRLDHAKSNH